MISIGNAESAFYAFRGTPNICSCRVENYAWMNGTLLRLVGIGISGTKYISIIMPDITDRNPSSHKMSELDDFLRDLDCLKDNDAEPIREVSPTVTKGGGQDDAIGNKDVFWFQRFGDSAGGAIIIV